ncbi:MAG: hypothetical protein A3E00_11285 [Curvibacter sp. RIFCSPHIGHO2_12_FULL_63_18]|nr:MAG: hypothetical protein A2037_04665 [Curvibacter sp. GWA2_63_95]OGP06869.1 MAG: hypothetical protein A3E00_11285 [Curvibacter sp. RIFCSPHIGHO2_12_FULL_63_18]HCX80227.1 hypothetical protein [Rhodoferax sp.]
MPLNIQKTAITFRFAFATLCWVLAWLFPYAEGGVPDLQSQVFMLLMLVLGALALGMARLHSLVWLGMGLASWVLWSTVNPYLGTKLAGISGMCLLGIACAVGASLRLQPRKQEVFLYAVVLAASINALQGLLQWFDLTGELYRWMSVPEQRGTAYGALRQRNLFATFLCVGLLCTLWLVYLRKLTSSMAWLVVALLTQGVAASGSRTGLLQVIVIAVLGVYWWRALPRMLAYLMVGQLLLLAAWSAWLPIAARLHGFEFVTGVGRVAQTAQDTRLVIWRNAINLILERPWFGWGWRELPYGRYNTVMDPYYHGLLDHAHNLPLQLAVELGLPITCLLGIGSLYGLYKGKFWRSDGLDTYGRAEPGTGRQFAWGILVLIVGVHSMLEYPLWSFGFLFLSGVAVGYLMPMVHINPAHRVVNGLHKALSLGCAAAILGLGSLAWVQYERLKPIYKTPFTNNIELKRSYLNVALERASDAWLFQGALDFATLTNYDINPSNAMQVRHLAEKLLHFSPEPVVVLPLLQSLWITGDFDALRYHGNRFCQAYPEYPQLWRRRGSMNPMTVFMLKNVDHCTS